MPLKLFRQTIIDEGTKSCKTLTPGPSVQSTDEYSPSHVTSPLTDDDDDKFEKAFEPKRSSASSPTPTPKSESKNDPKPKLLGTNRASKLLHSFKVSKAVSGPISLDLGKSARPKISKLKNFDDDENDQVGGRGCYGCKLND